MTDEVLRDLKKDGVLLLTLHRPERNNAWNADMETAYFARSTMPLPTPTCGRSC